MIELPHDWTLDSLSNLVNEVRVSVTPEAGKGYELWSVPSFADRQPDRVDGSAIGSAKRRVQPCDVLLCKINPRINRVWIVGQEPDGLEQIASPEWLVLRTPDVGSRVLPEYLRHYLASPAFRDWIVMAVSGVTGSHTRAKAKPILDQTVPVPPLDEQRRIVDILEDHLSRLDAAASSIEGAKRRLIALHRSTLNGEFSGAGYARVPLRELVSGIEAGRSFGGSSHPAADGEWGIIKVSAMTWGKFRASENKAIASDRADVRYEINKGDLLLSRANTNAYVGASVLVGDVRPRLLLSDKSLRIIAAPGVVREWLWRALSTPDARAQMSAAATGTKDSMRNISQAALMTIELSAVPVVDQTAAVARSLEVEAAIARLTADLEAAAVRGGRLRRALLTAAFSGRLTDGSADMEMVKEMALV